MMKTIKNKVRAGVLLLAVSVLVSCVQADFNIPFNITREGTPSSTVVISGNPSPSEEWAAKEFVRCVKAISGAELKVVHTDAAKLPKGPVILLGHDTVKKFAPKVSLQGLGDEGFILQCDNDRLIIAGGKLRGTMYGVFTLLEKLGCRWWAPGTEDLPSIASISLPAFQDTQAPVFEYRDILYRPIGSLEGNEFCARNKLNGMAWGNAPEHLGKQFTIDKLRLAHTHPKLMKASGVEVTDRMYAQTKNDGIHKRQYCLTHPDVRAAMTKAVLARFAEHPEVPFITMGHSDTKTYCECAECSALSEAEGSTGAPSLELANHVADAVAKEYPDKRILFLAYQWTRKPPATIKPRNNVMVILCPIECDYAHPLATGTEPDNVSFRKDIETWSKITGKLYIWDYIVNYSHFLMPFSNITSLGPNVKFFRDHKVVGLFEQACHTGWGSEYYQLKMWLLCKMMWNPDLDSDALIREFCNGFYGPAGEEVYQGIMAAHELAQKESFTMQIGLSTGLGSRHLEAGCMAEAYTLISKGLEKVKGDAKYEPRVQHALFPYRYLLLKRGVGSVLWKKTKAQNPELNVPEIASALLDTAEEYNIDAIGDHEPFAPWAGWLESLIQSGGQPAYPEEFTPGEGNTFIQGCQFGTRGRWFQESEGASDGWSVKNTTGAWTVRRALMPNEEYIPGERYRLFIRVKAGEKYTGTGALFSCGLSMEKKIYKQFTAEDLNLNEWTVVDLGEFTGSEEVPYFWFANGTSGKVIPSILLDCLWLERIEMN